MSLTALEVIGWPFQDQVFKRLCLPSVYSLFVSLILLELATASFHVVGSPVERPVQIVGEMKPSVEQNARY